MKKILVISILAIALLVTACASNEITPTSPQTEDSTAENSIPEETQFEENGENNMEEEFVWIEEGESMLDESGRVIENAIRYEEVDLSDPTSRANNAWDRSDLEIEPRSDLSSILGQRITTRDEAAEIANLIIASEQQRGAFFGGDALELMLVEHAPNEDIWIFGYWVNDILVDGNSFHVAVNGNTGELIRMWVE